MALGFSFARKSLIGAALAVLALGSPVTARDDAAGRYAPPSVRFGALFAAVQGRHLFADSKSFADAVPKHALDAIMADYRRRPFADDAALRAFVLANFAVPAVIPAPRAQPDTRPLDAHIAALWPQLTRTTPSAPAGGSALALPKPYVVPGGRFRELYYWDSYFTMLGLAASRRDDLVDSMIDDFGSLIARFGHIPNGTRTYYLSRSQPPFFALMVGLSHDRSLATLRRRTAWMRAEHRFWMAGADRLKPGGADRRVVRLPDGSLLNRYWDDRAAPRDESWREDTALARAHPERDAAGLYRDLRAAAESGWDFSSRWLADPKDLATIRTTRIVPVDLNSLMLMMEQRIAAACRRLADRPCVARYDSEAAARARAIAVHLWNARTGYFADYDLDNERVRTQLTAAAAYPLFAGLASPAQASATATALPRLAGPGGLAATLERNGQQWDAPNGWAPLQWIAVTGLARYGQCALADRIAQGWIANVARDYRAGGKLLEKYDVLEQAPGGGGEYPLQDGFGWTNGVTLALEKRPACAEASASRKRRPRRR